eukprot:GHVS01007582.1.p1 GENE.GHVS01007582.1~~GHVS01007582.1.p1  ORF type:complete len:429 (-),score=28.71 GHVS01007582.1:413-1519(-)
MLFPVGVSFMPMLESTQGSLMNPQPSSALSKMIPPRNKKDRSETADRFNRECRVVTCRVSSYVVQYYVVALELALVDKNSVGAVTLEIGLKENKSVAVRYTFDDKHMFLTALERFEDFVEDEKEEEHCVVCNSTRDSRLHLNQDDFEFLRNQFDNDMSVMDGSIGNSQTTKKSIEASANEEFGSGCSVKIGHVRPGAAMYVVLDVSTKMATSVWSANWAWRLMEENEIAGVFNVAMLRDRTTLTVLKRFNDFIEDPTKGAIRVSVCRPKGSRLDLTPDDVEMLRESLPFSSSKDISNAENSFAPVVNAAILFIGIVLVGSLVGMFVAYAIAYLHMVYRKSCLRSKSNKRCGVGERMENFIPGGSKNNN